MQIGTLILWPAENMCTMGNVFLSTDQEVRPRGVEVDPPARRRGMPTGYHVSTSMCSPTGRVPPGTPMFLYGLYQAKELGSKRLGNPIGVSARPDRCVQPGFQVGHPAEGSCTGGAQKDFSQVQLPTHRKRQRERERERERDTERERERETQRERERDRKTGHSNFFKEAEARLEGAIIGILVAREKLARPTP